MLKVQLSLGLIEAMTWKRVTAGRLVLGSPEDFQRCSAASVFLPFKPLFVKYGRKSKLLDERANNLNRTPEAPKSLWARGYVFMHLNNTNPDVSMNPRYSPDPPYIHACGLFYAL